MTDLRVNDPTTLYIAGRFDLVGDLRAVALAEVEARLREDLEGTEQYVETCRRQLASGERRRDLLADALQRFTGEAP